MSWPFFGLVCRGHSCKSGKKKQLKHKLFGPDFPRTFLTLTPGRPWVKSFSPSPGPQENPLFGADVHVLHVKIKGVIFSKGVLQSEVLDEVWVLEGGSLGRSFWRSLVRSFGRSFRACFAGTFRAEKTSAKTSAQNSHGSAQQNSRKFREKLHDEVLQGDPRQSYFQHSYCRGQVDSRPTTPSNPLTPLLPKRCSQAHEPSPSPPPTTHANGR